MTNQYTSSTNFVQNGDNTTEDPENLVGASHITIMNPEIQWEGSETTGESTSYSTNTNTTTAQATTSKEYSTASNSDTIPPTSVSDEDFENEDSDSDSSTLDNSAGTYSFSADTSTTVPVVESPDSSVTYELVDIDITGYAEYDMDGRSGTNQFWYDMSYQEGSYTDEETDQALNTEEVYYTITDSDAGSLDPDLSDGDSVSLDIDGEVELEEGEDTSGEIYLDLFVTATYEKTETYETTVSYPFTPSGYDSHEGHSYEIYDETNGEVIETDSTTQYLVGEEKTINSGDVEKSLTMKTEGSKEVTESDTSETSYPSVPSGYSFNRHYWREELNGDFHDSNFTYSNSVGESRSITSEDSDDEWYLEMRTRGSDTTYYTEYTDSPSVSGDVSAAFGGTLSDDETSGWYTLSGFSIGSNSISHSISDSNEGYYQIRFDWDFLPPESPGDVTVSGPEF